MRTPPPAVPGIAHANSIPPSPPPSPGAGSRRSEHRRRPSTGAVDLDRGQLSRRVGARARPRRRPPRARSTRARRRRRQRRLARPGEQALELGELFGPPEVARRAADAHGRQPRERNVLLEPGRNCLWMIRHSSGPLPSPTRNSFAATLISGAGRGSAPGEGIDCGRRPSVAELAEDDGAASSTLPAPIVTATSPGAREAGNHPPRLVELGRPADPHPGPPARERVNDHLARHARHGLLTRRVDLRQAHGIRAGSTPRPARRRDAASASRDAAGRARARARRDAAPAARPASPRPPPGDGRSRRTPSLPPAAPRSSSLLPAPRKRARTPAASAESTPASSSAASAAAAFRRLWSPATASSNETGSSVLPCTADPHPSSQRSKSSRPRDATRTSSDGRVDVREHPDLGSQQLERAVRLVALGDEPPVPARAFEPSWGTAPPMRNAGSRPSSCRQNAIIAAVVVLPCAPATTIDRRDDTSSARSSPRDRPARGPRTRSRRRAPSRPAPRAATARSRRPRRRAARDTASRAGPSRRPRSPRSGDDGQRAHARAADPTNQSLRPLNAGKR